MEASSLTAPAGLPRTRRLGDRVGDVVLTGLTGLAALIALVLIAAIVWRVAAGAWPAIKVFHLDFLWNNTWNPVTSKFGEATLHDGGAGLVLRVRIEDGKQLARGEQALIVDYDAELETYLVEPMRDLMEAKK